MKNLFFKKKLCIGIAAVFASVSIPGKMPVSAEAMRETGQVTLKNRNTDTNKITEKNTDTATDQSTDERIDTTTDQSTEQYTNQSTDIGVSKAVEIGKTILQECQKKELSSFAMESFDNLCTKGRENPSFYLNYIPDVIVLDSNPNVQEVDIQQIIENAKEILRQEESDAVDNEDAIESEETVENKDAIESKETVENKDAAESKEAVENKNVSESKEAVENKNVSESKEAVENKDAIENAESIKKDDASKEKQNKETENKETGNKDNSNKEKTQPTVTSKTGSIGTSVGSAKTTFVASVAQEVMGQAGIEEDNGKIAQADLQNKENLSKKIGSDMSMGISAATNAEEAGASTKTNAEEAGASTKTNAEETGASAATNDKSNLENSAKVMSEDPQEEETEPEFRKELENMEQIDQLLARFLPKDSQYYPYHIGSYWTDEYFSEPGEHVVLVDCGNNNAKNISIQILDTEPPVITGVKNMNVALGNTISYRSGIVVTDNSGEEPELMIDASAVNTGEVGVYNVIYSATDSAGNTATETARVTIFEEKIIDRAYVDAMGQEVINRIIKDGMSDMEKVKAIYDWTKSNISYVGSSDKSSVVAGAYEGFRTKKGDCYTYYACCEILLNLCGFEAIMVKREGGATNHYWNLVKFGNAYYHLDACPRRNSGYVCFLQTDAQLAAFTEYYNSVKLNYYNFDHSLYPASGTEIIYGSDPF